MTTLRLVVVGRFCGNEEVVVVEPLFQDSWHEGAANAIDAPQPKPLVGRRWPLRIDRDAELQELIDGMDDEQFNRYGGA